MTEREPNLMSIFKNSPNTMIKLVQKYNVQKIQQKELINLFQQCDSNIKKNNGNNEEPQYVTRDLIRLCENQEFLLILETMLQDSQFDSMVIKSKKIKPSFKSVYMHELKDYYILQLKQTCQRFKNISSKQQIKHQINLYQDREQTKKQQNQNQNHRDSYIDQNSNEEKIVKFQNDELEQQTALRNSATLVESVSNGDNQSLYLDLEQDNQNYQAPNYQGQIFQEEEFQEYQNIGSDFYK